MKELLTCPICQKQYQTLNSHIHFKHKLSTEEFLEQYPGCKLVSDNLRKIVSDSCKKSGCGKWIKGYKYPDWRLKQYSKKFSGKNNPFYGKKHSKEAREKMSKNHADFTGDKNPLVNWLKDNEKNRKKYKRMFKNIWKVRKLNKKYMKDFKEKLSKSMAKTYINGFNPYTNCKRGWIKIAKFNNKFYYGSSYEKKFLEFCEMSNDILFLKKVPFRIPYVGKDGINRNYIADFLVNNKIVIEIKPKSMLNYNNNQEKKKYAIRYCLKNGYKYKLLTESKLKNLNKIDWS